MNLLSGVYSSSIMYLYPRVHDSILRDKNQAFGENMVNFTRATGVLQAKQNCYRRSCFPIRGDNSLNDQVNKFKIVWDEFFY